MISRKAATFASGSSGFSPWKTISTFFFCSITLRTRVASEKSLLMPSVASTAKRGTATSLSSKAYSMRIRSL